MSDYGTCPRCGQQVLGYQTTVGFLGTSKHVCPTTGGGPMRHTDAEIAEIIRRGQADELERLADELDPPKVDRSLRGLVVLTHADRNSRLYRDAREDGLWDGDVLIHTWAWLEARSYLSIRPLVRRWDQWSEKEREEFAEVRRGLLDDQEAAACALYIALREPGGV